MTEHPVYVLAAAPREKVRLRDLFRSGPGTVMELMQNPGYTRAFGWDLRTLDDPRIVEGEFLEVGYSDYKLIRTYEDGTVVLRAAADHSLLGWGREEAQFAQKPRLNPIALIELTYHFVLFYQAILAHLTASVQTIVFTAELHGAILGNGQRLYLIPYTVGTFAWELDSDKHPAPKADMSKQVEVASELLHRNPGAVAYRLIEKVYTWFGVPTDQIPYVAATNPQEPVVSIGSLEQV